MLLLPEVTAAIARVYQDAELATSVATNMALPHLTLVPMNEAIADIAINVAAHQRLRGSDAVYAAVARRYNTTLVTLDQEQATRMGSVVTTQSPAAAVAALTVPDEHESADGPEHAA
ncbi:MAG: PIN domain-containing protein [Caldilineaceae bacterium]